MREPAHAEHRPREGRRRKGGHELLAGALARGVQAPLSGWDLAFAGIHDWYRE
jgi:hypothetical protein